MEHDAQNRRPAHADFFSHDDSRLHIFDDGIHSESIAGESALGHDAGKEGLELAAIVFLEGVTRQFQQFLIKGEQLLSFAGSEVS